MLRQRTATNQLEHFHFCLLHNDAVRSVGSLAPRSAAERGEGWGEGHFLRRIPLTQSFMWRPPSCPLPRKRGEGAIMTSARVTTSHHFKQPSSFPRRVFAPGV